MDSGYLLKAAQLFPYMLVLPRKENLATKNPGDGNRRGLGFIGQQDGVGSDTSVSIVYCKDDSLFAESVAKHLRKISLWGT